MALQDIFKFRELPENVKAVSRTSRGPAVDGRENGDRSSPGDDGVFRLSFNARASHAGATPRSRSTSGRTQSARHYRFVCNFVSSRVLRRHRRFVSIAPVFYRAIRSSRADRSRETFFISSNPRELWPLSAGRTRLLFLVASENDSLLFPRHPIAGMGADLDGAAILFFRNEIRSRFRTGI